ncbi:MAG: hypothetical protein M1820_004578 [Bogoriella megaspora]|nr:MAG: hypothetical protein M1820_004578 [Bogoriella megaspora]
MSSIPVVDISAFTGRSDSEEREAAAKKEVLRDAFAMMQKTIEKSGKLGVIHSKSESERASLEKALD